LIVVESIASLKVALTADVTDTLVARLTGTVEITVGGVVSPVVKLNSKFTPIALPATSLTFPETVTV